MRSANIIHNQRWGHCPARTRSHLRNVTRVVVATSLTAMMGCFSLVLVAAIAILAPPAIASAVGTNCRPREVIMFSARNRIAMTLRRWGQGDGNCDRGIAATYSKLAFIYDAWSWITERKSLDAALSCASIRDGEAVLEIAVGTGIVFRKLLLKNPVGRNVGLDLTEAMLRRARQKAKHTGIPHSLEVGDARVLLFPKESFDVVLSNNMLGLLSDEDISLALGEMMRVLRPGGRLVLVTMLCPTRKIARCVYRLGAIRLGAWRDLSPVPMVMATGFNNVEVQVVTQFGIPSEILTARRSASQIEA